MLMKNIVLLLLINSSVFSQELYKNDFEKGYVKDGIKVSVWQYFDSKGEPELAINHSTGKVIFISKDTTDYVVYKNGEWVSSKLDVRPMPISGTHNFFQAIRDTLKYPVKDFMNGLQGKVIASFEVDTLGAMINYNIIKGVGGACDSAVLAALKSKDQKWIPAMMGGKRCSTKFAIACEFRQKNTQQRLQNEDFEIDKKAARFLGEFTVKVPGTDSDLVFIGVERQAQFPGGFDKMYKFIEKNLKYPPAAKRMGIEGKVFVKFIIERDGSITNISIEKGISGDCDKEAFRLVSVMPKWVPGEQRGQKVRSYYTLPVRFRL